MQSILKHRYVRQGPNATGTVRAHIRYLQNRPGKDLESSRYRKIFSANFDDVPYKQVFARVDEQPSYGTVVHKLILSPEAADVNLKDYTREVMHAIARQTTKTLEWYAIEHRNTSHPHCHVVVMGTDSIGKQVRLSLDSYSAGRQAGSEYQERNRLAKSKDEASKSLRQRLLSKVRNLAVVDGEDTARTLSKQSIDAKRSWRLRDLTHASEPSVIGDLPDPVLVSAKATRRNLRLKLRMERQWRDYATPIKIDYGQSKDEPVQYSWLSNLFALRELEREYLDNDPFVRNSMSPDQFAKLQLWIKHRYVDEKLLDQQANDIARMELQFPDDLPIVLDRHSKDEHIRDLLTMHESGEVSLTDIETRALELWLQVPRKSSRGLRADRSAGVCKTSYSKQPNRRNQPTQSKTKLFRKAKDERQAPTKYR